MEIEELDEVQNDVNDLRDNIVEYIKRLILICRSYNYMSRGDMAGTIKSNGFVSKIKTDMSGHPWFSLKYRRTILLNVMYNYARKEEIVLYTGGYYIDMNELGLIKEFAAEIKKNIEVMNINLGEII